MGYTGGTTENPTYYRLGNHTETIQLDYDPTLITYEDLLIVFWDSHSPTLPMHSVQYMSIIFYHNEEQKQLALESKQREETRLGRPIYTEIRPASEFYIAEDYHQKYYLQQVPQLMSELTGIYTSTEDFIASTAAARLNGYVGGYGDPDTLKEQLDSFGLSEDGKKALLKIGEKGLSPACAVAIP